MVGNTYKEWKEYNRDLTARLVQLETELAIVRRMLRLAEQENKEFRNGNTGGPSGTIQQEEIGLPVHSPGWGSLGEPL
jgi:hypothetical protein